MRGMFIVILLAALAVGLLYFFSVGGKEKGEYSGPAISKVQETFDVSALAAARSAAHAQSRYHLREDRYAVDLNELYTVDRGVSSDPEVTFVFGICNKQKYEFTTVHARGKKSYVFKN